jgi:hypothetical protein
VTSVTGQAQAALIALQARARHTTDIFVLEQIDRALDEVVRLNSTQPPAFQTRSAMANAGKVLRRRRSIVPVISLANPQLGKLGIRDPQIAVVELRLWLQTTSALPEGQRGLLTLIMDCDADAVAAELGVSPARMRERISRARRAAFIAYTREVVAA